jgi:hypothetical protein
MRMASIITSAPVALSVAPDAPSHESKWALSTTYSSRRRRPRIIATVFMACAAPVYSARASTRSTGPCPFAARRKSSP